MIDFGMDRDHFDEESIERLKSILGYGDRSTAESAANQILTAVGSCQMTAYFFETWPNAKASKRRLSTIASTSRKLSALLSDIKSQGLLGTVLASEEGSQSKSQDVSLFGQYEWPKLALSVMSDLEHAARRAINLIERGEFEEQTLRPSNIKFNNAKTAIVVRELWPTLFRIWAEAGKNVAGTENGPTYKFVMFVHDVYNLEIPKHGTFQ
jgi:hypothetical protein